MKDHRLFIKNMVCPRCVLTVEGILNKLEIPFYSVILGEVVLKTTLPAGQLALLDNELKQVGFELIDNRLSVLIENIKKAVIEYTDALGDTRRENLSAFLVEKLNYEYTYLSHLFSAIEGVTIEQFFILQRIEKAKELLVYNRYSINEIADQLGYSSVHHLSAQFKKVTGLTPSHFKKIGLLKRRSIDSL